MLLLNRYSLCASLGYMYYKKPEETDSKVISSDLTWTKDFQKIIKEEPYIPSFFLWSGHHQTFFAVVSNLFGRSLVQIKDNKIEKIEYQK